MGLPSIINQSIFDLIYGHQKEIKERQGILLFKMLQGTNNIKYNEPLMLELNLFLEYFGNIHNSALNAVSYDHSSFFYGRKHFQLYSC